MRFYPDFQRLVSNDDKQYDKNDLSFFHNERQR
jgi:hypothetical protein